MQARSSSQTRYRLNNWTAGVVATTVFLAPLALGGNRPAIWALSAALLFAWAAVYFARLGFADVSLRATTGRYRTISGLFWLFTAFIVLQLLPIADLLPRSWLTLPGDVDPGRSISITPGDTALALLRWLSYGLLFYLCLQVGANRLRSSLFLKVLFGIVVAHAVYGLLLYFEFEDTILFTEKWAYQGFVTGGFVNRNSYATFLAIGATIGSALIGTIIGGATRWLDLFEGRRGQFIFFLAGLLLIAAALVLTASRMGFFAAICGSVSAFAISVLRLNRRLSMAAIATSILLGLLIFSALLFLYGNILVERLGSVESAANVRADLYRQVLTMIADRPLLGFGGSSFEYAYPLYHTAPVSFDLAWDKTHNTYLEMWVSYGVFFGTIPLAILTTCFVTLLKLLRPEGKDESASIAAIGTLVVCGVHSTVDFSLEIQGVAYLFVAVVANGMGGIAQRSLSRAN